MKKKLSILLAIVLMFASPMQSLAQEQQGFVDMPNNWSTEALTKAVENGLLSGYNNRLYPDNNLTRAEMASVINRAFGATESVDISSYTDVLVTDWYYDAMTKAVRMGTFKGYANQLRPNDPITREEVFVVLGKALKLKAETSNKIFMDSTEVSDWAKESVNGMVNSGYISGSNGKLNPKANITRAEFAQVMHNIIKDYVNTSEVYEEVSEGNVVVNVPNATLKNLVIKGDLIIADGVGEGEVTLENVKVEGRVLVRGGGENSIIIKGDSEIDTIIIVKNGNKVRILNETGVEIAVATVEGEADVILEGKFKNVVVQSPDITVLARDTEIDKVEVNGTRSTVIVDENSKIEKVLIKANRVIIEGNGEVKEVEVEAGGSGASITTPQTQINVDKGVNDVIGTGGVEIKPNETYVNGKTETQDAKPLDQSPSTGGSSGGSSSGGTVTTYTVNYSVVGSNGTLTGTVASGNSVNSGTSVTFTATPSTGYEVKEWKVNEVVVTNGNTLTRTVSGNTTVTVEFKEIVVVPTMYTVTYSVIGEGGTLIASVTNGGEAQAGSSVSFTAVPDEGYKLKEWTVNGEVIDWLTGLEVSRDMDMDVDFKVEFELINPTPETYTLTYSVIGDGGTLTGEIPSGTQATSGSTVKLTATPSEGYRVKAWTVNETIVSDFTAKEYTVEMDRNVDVKVEFEEIPVSPIMYTVTYEVIGEGGTIEALEGLSFEPNPSDETINSGDEVLMGTDFRFIITPDENKQIRTITLNGGEVGKTNTLDVESVSQNIHLTVEFETIEYNLNFSVVGGNGSITATSTTYANVTDGMKVYRGTSIRFESIPEDGYRIKDWKLNGTSMGASLAVELAFISEDTNVTAEFEEIPIVTHLLRITVTPSDATVTVTDSSDNVMTGTFTAGNSQWTYDLPVGVYDIKIEKAGYKTHTDTQNMIGPSSHTITLDSINNSPLATDDEVTVVNNMTILIDVLANDTDADGDTLSITSYTQGTNGIVTQEGDRLRYDPNTDFIGMDEFDYEISDGNGETSSALVRVTVNPNGTKLGTGSYQGNDISFYMGESGLIAVLEGQVSTIGDVVAENYTSVVDIVSMDNSVALIYMWEGNIEVSRVVAIGQNAVESEHSIVEAYGVISGIEYAVAYNEIIHFTYLDSQGSPDPYNKPDLMYSNTSDGAEILVQRAYQDLSSSGSWGADYIESGYTISVDNEGNPVVAYIRRNIWKWSNGNDTTFYLHIENPLTQENIIIESNYKTNIYSNLQLTGGGSTIGYSYDESGVSVAGIITANPLSVDLR